MRDYLFVSFSLGHQAGQDARRLLSSVSLLEEAESDSRNRDAWAGALQGRVMLKLLSSDPRIEPLLQALASRGVKPLLRLDREHSKSELDSAAWLVMRVATAGLWGGVDYGQAYDHSDACPTCGAGARPVPPLLADLGSMGKKDIDHLVYEEHLVISSRITEGLVELTGVDLLPVKSPKRPPHPGFRWLAAPSGLPPMDKTTTGYSTDGLCPTCGRGGHHRAATQPEVPTYREIPSGTPDFNRTFEYYWDWRQVRASSHVRPVGGGAGWVVSQRARQVLLGLGVRRLVWVPVLELARRAAEPALPADSGSR